MIPLLLLVGLGLGFALLSSNEPSGEGRATFVRWQPPAKTLPRFQGHPRNSTEAAARLKTLLAARPDAATHADGYSHHMSEYFPARNMCGEVGWFTLREIETYNAALQAAWESKGPIPDYPGFIFEKEYPREWSHGATLACAKLPTPRSTADKNAWLMLRLGQSGVGATFARDEYGRFYKGVKGNPLGAMLTAAGIALPFIPGIGPAASAALAGLIAIGQGKSLKDAALAAARAAIPGGALAQAGFDTAVAVASGEPVDDAVVNSFLAQYPAAKAGYEQGKEAYKALHSELGA